MKTADRRRRRHVELPDDIFGIEPNVAVMHQVVTAQLAAKRAGTHSTKTRAEVRGGGAKPWRQKGTGRARQGSIRAPQWRGGGVAHGPKPRDYSQRTPKKMVRLALRSRALRPGGRGQGHRGRRLGDRRAEDEGRGKLLEAIGLRTKGERGARARGAVPHRRGGLEVDAQPRRARADRPAGRAEHVRRARERLDRVLAGVARHASSPGSRDAASGASVEGRGDDDE